MDKNERDNIVKMLESGNDGDVAMGIRALQGYLQSENILLGDAVCYVLDHIADLRPDTVVVPAPAMAAPQPVKAVTGAAQCRVAGEGGIEIVPAGAATGTVVPLTGGAAQAVVQIAGGMMDALAAADLTKSRFKLKLNDIKNGQGAVIETILQAEYEKDGIAATKVWSSANRGDVAVLATSLRRAMAAALPALIY